MARAGGAGLGAMGGMVAEPVARVRSLTDRAHDMLRRAIITCQMPPGLEISEQDLAERLEMSKTPVREALARLALAGLVEAFPRRGYRVTPVTVRDVNDLFVVRGALEGTAAELAASRMDAADLDALEGLAEATYVPGEAPSRTAFVEANAAFHTAIARGSGVERLAGLVVAHLEEATRLFHMGAHYRDVNPETTAEHRQIVEILRGRDPARAREALMRHNETTRRGLLNALVADPQSGLSL